MKRSEGRGTDFPTECGAVGDKLLIATTWDKVTCNNCIRKFGPDAAKSNYVAQAKEKGVKTPDVIREEKSVDASRMNKEGLINNLRSQQMRLEGIKISVMSMMDPMARIDEESVGELVACSEWIDAALHNLGVVKQMIFSNLNGEEVFPAKGVLDESDN
jgi:hypothetical protein